MKPIDQIMVRKLGGWNLIYPADWVKMSLTERDALLADDAVQFFGDGAQIDTMEAIASLSPDMGAEPQPEEKKPEPTVPENQIVELTPADLVTATYSRQVISGPAWQIQRANVDDIAVPFSKFRGHPSDDVYDLLTKEGTLTLIADLMTDVFGHTGDSRELIPLEAAQFFDDNFFSTSLGDRFWEVTAKDVRAQVAKNPYIKLLNNA